MPNKLRRLTVDEGSLVDDPANPKARVLFFKRGGENVTTKHENGHDFPAEAFAYVPDPEKPSTWKLRLWETPDKKETANQTGMAADALGPGLFGNPVKIPEEDLPKVKSKVLAAWKKTHPDAKDDEIPEALKKSKPIRKFRDLIRKFWYAGEGWDFDGNGSGYEPARNLDATLNQDDYSDQLLAVLTAGLADTIDSVLDDDSVADKQTQIDSALTDYKNRLLAVGILKSGRKMSQSRLDNLKQMHQSLGSLISELDGESNNDPGKEDDNVQIDKSKLPENVRNYVEELEAKVQKSAPAPADPTPTPDDILKANLPEPLRKRFEELEQKAKDAEDIAKREREARLEREYVQKASGYKGLAVQPDEFGKVLKSLAEKAPEEYAKLDAVLKTADEQIAKGKLFSELGGDGSNVEGSAMAQLNELAKQKIEKSAGKLTHAQAFTEVLKERPDLYKKYREEA